MKVINASLADGPRLYELHADAFSTFQVFGPPWWSDVPTLQSILTCRREFDPGLSRILVEDTGEPLGHALWNSFTLRLEGQDIRTAILAPLGVRSDRQKEGLGSLLMEDGLRILEERRFELLLILGHPEYYPKFGLKTRCYGQSGVEVTGPTTEPAPDSLLRPLRPSDMPVLNDLWEKICGDDPGTLVPDQGFIAWCSRIKDVAAGVLEVDGQVEGYFRADLRSDTDPRAAARAFLASGPAQAATLLALLHRWIPSWKNTSPDSFFLPLGQESGNRLFPGAARVTEVWDGGMALALPGAKQKYLEGILEEIRSGARPPLGIQWGPLFDE